MAIDQGTATIAVDTQERTWRVNIETAKGADPVVTVWREVVKTAPDGSIVSKVQGAMVQRALSAVATQTIAVPGASPPIVLTMARLAETIAATADQWRQEDINTSAPVVAP
jgi:hypothetical protein